VLSSWVFVVPATVNCPPTYVFPRASTEKRSVGVLPLDRCKRLNPVELFPTWPDIRFPVVRLAFDIFRLFSDVVELRIFRLPSPSGAIIMSPSDRGSVVIERPPVPFMDFTVIVSEETLEVGGWTIEAGREGEGVGPVSGKPRFESGLLDVGGRASDGMDSCWARLLKATKGELTPVGIFLDKVIASTIATSPLSVVPEARRIFLRLGCCGVRGLNILD